MLLTNGIAKLLPSFFFLFRRVKVKDTLNILP